MLVASFFYVRGKKLLFLRNFFNSFLNSCFSFSWSLFDFFYSFLHNFLHCCFCCFHSGFFLCNWHFAPLLCPAESQKICLKIGQNLYIGLIKKILSSCVKGTKSFFTRSRRKVVLSCSCYLLRFSKKFIKSCQCFFGCVLRNARKGLFSVVVPATLR
jgi:hypothetical protein